MILDGHIHAESGVPRPAQLLRRMKDAGVAGGLILSPAPPSYGGNLGGADAAERLESVLAWTNGHRLLYPFFWIDPLEPSALRQVQRAVRQGIAGFKIICIRSFPGERRTLKVCRAIAETGRPVLFHCGILWNGRPSSVYNRPVEFEVLLDVPGLRFALSHIGWPWCDELLAVYGKFEMARRTRPDLTVEMFIDTTPGTPPIYRREALKRLFTIGYDVRRNVFFGTDGLAHDYNVAWARQWLARDRRIARSLRLSAAAQSRMFATNLQRFVHGE